MAPNTTIWVLTKGKNRVKRKTLIEPSRRPEIFGRRRTQTGIFLRVWDLGQYIDGSDRDDLTRHFNFVGNSALVTAFAAFNSIMFSDDYEDWDTIYKEVTDSIDDYNLDPGDFDEYVPGKGLRPTSDTPIIHVHSQNKYFTTWLSPLSTKIKITNNPTSPASTDPAATLTIDKSCDLFLAPGLHNRFGLAVYDPDEMVDDDETGYELQTVQAPLPRTLVGSSEFDTIWENRINPSAASVIDISFYRNLFLNDRTPIMLVVPPGTSTDPNTFPTESDHPGQWDFGPRIGFTPATKVGGHLLAAIRKHTSPVEWYFVWAGTGGYSPSDPEGIGAFGAWAYGFGSFIVGEDDKFGLLV